MHARQGFDFERQDGRELRFGEAADIGDRKLGVRPRLRRQFAQGLPALGVGHLEGGKGRFIELLCIFAYRHVAALRARCVMISATSVSTGLLSLP